jgi:hypothetical protein
MGACVLINVGWYNCYFCEGSSAIVFLHKLLERTLNANLTVPSYCVTIVIRNYAVKRFSFTCQTRSNLNLGIWMPFRERLKSNYNK